MFSFPADLLKHLHTEHIFNEFPATDLGSRMTYVCRLIGIRNFKIRLNVHSEI
jgi:hypothetical protein